MQVLEGFIYLNMVVIFHFVLLVFNVFPVHCYHSHNTFLHQGYDSEAAAPERKSIVHQRQVWAWIKSERLSFKVIHCAVPNPRTSS